MINITDVPTMLMSQVCPNVTNVTPVSLMWPTYPTAEDIAYPQNQVRFSRRTSPSITKDRISDLIYRADERNGVNNKNELTTLDRKVGAVHGELWWVVGWMYNCGKVVANSQTWDTGSNGLRISNDGVFSKTGVVSSSSCAITIYY